MNYFIIFCFCIYFIGVLFTECLYVCAVSVSGHLAVDSARQKKIKIITMVVVVVVVVMIMVKEEKEKRVVRDTEKRNVLTSSTTNTSIDRPGICLQHNP